MHLHKGGAVVVIQKWIYPPKKANSPEMFPGVLEMWEKARVSINKM